MKNNKIRRHKFTPGAMSIIQMGEELIGHPTTAINELIKNSYDADADECFVYFHLENENSFMLIKDNGSGMDSNMLFGKWLQPSMSDKRKLNAKSRKYKRSFLGNKGIGRLAAMSLGRYTTVVSKMRASSQYNWITLDREGFKDDSKFLSNVLFPGDSIDQFTKIFSDSNFIKTRNVKKNDQVLKILNSNKLQSFNCGALIIIEDLDLSVLLKFKEELNKKSFLEENSNVSIKSSVFYRSLESLISPIKVSSNIQKDLFDKNLIPNKKLLSVSDDNFSIKFSISLLNEGAEKEKIYWLDISPVPIDSIFNYRLFGKVTKEGTAKGIITYNRIKNDYYSNEIEITSDGLGLISSNEKGSLSLFENEIKSTLDVGEFYFDIRVYDMGEKDNLEDLTMRSGLKNVKEFQAVFKKVQGLRVVKNGFGVKPYGEEYEDWIDLSRARVDNPGKNLNTKQIVGYVLFYSPDNDLLEEKTNREGFLENVAFEEVKSALKSIFKIYGNLRYVYRLKNNLGRPPQSKHNRPDFEEYVNTLNKKLNEKSGSAEIQTLTQKFVTNVQTAMDNLEQSLSFSERLASLGSGIELVFHEMGQPISNLKAIKSSLNLKKSKVPESILEKFTIDIEHLVESTNTLADLRDSLKPAIGKSQVKSFNPKNTFIKVCGLFKKDINQDDNEINIKIDSEFDHYEIIDQEYALWVAFLNIVNNAVYWIRKSGVKGEIKLLKEGDSIVISNNGPKISENIIDMIFEYGVTSKLEKNATGLGLAYTQSVLSNIGWEISAKNKKYGPTFTLKRIKND